MWSVKRTRTALLCFAALCESFASASFLGVAQDKSLEATRHPLFVVRERVHPLIGSLDCPQGRVVYGVSYSVFTVFTDGKGTNAVWHVPPCSDPAKAVEWAAPADAKTHDFALSPDALAQLRNFLDRSEVKALRDFMNATSGVGDYIIEIQRPSGLQKIQVVSLMPDHYSLKRDPTLLRLICLAKQLTGDERPLWCSDLR
jgi:hypothetical protein